MLTCTFSGPVKVLVAHGFHGNPWKCLSLRPRKPRALPGPWTSRLRMQSSGHLRHDRILSQSVRHDYGSLTAARISPPRFPQSCSLHLRERTKCVPSGGCNWGRVTSNNSNVTGSCQSWSSPAFWPETCPQSSGVGLTWLCPHPYSHSSQLEDSGILWDPWGGLQNLQSLTVVVVLNSSLEKISSIYKRTEESITDPHVPLGLL